MAAFNHKVKNKQLPTPIHRVSTIINRFVFCLFYIGAGVNHFWHPKGYIDLIPPYLPVHYLLNIISGILEISGSILMMIPYTRKLSVIIIISLLIAFIPVHIYMVQMNGCISSNFCIASWMAWARLPLQVPLIWWAWKTYKSGKINNEKKQVNNLRS